MKVVNLSHPLVHQVTDKTDKTNDIFFINVNLLKFNVFGMVEIKNLEGLPIICNKNENHIVNA